MPERKNRAALSPEMRAQFDALVERMQTPEARAAMDRAFRATPEELGAAARG